jgi:phenylalanyl-tRNA synthetase beta subunit
LESGVVATCGARFTRKACTVTLPGCTVEIALDVGILMGNNREMPLCEVEIELKSGSEEAAIVFAEIDIDALSHIGAERIKYVEPSRFPGMEQDLTFMAETYAPIKAAIDAANSPLVNKVAVVGTYTDENGKSITVRIFFSHAERTLTREEVQAVVDGVVADLETQGIVIKK